MSDTSLKSDEQIFSEVRKKLLSDNIKLSESPYSLTNGQQGDNLMALVDRYAAELSIDKDRMCNVIETLRVHYVEKMKIRRIFEATGNATLRVTLVSGQCAVDLNVHTNNGSSLREKVSLLLDSEVPASHIKLMTAGRVLKDNVSLFDQQIGPESNITGMILSDLDLEEEKKRPIKLANAMNDAEISEEMQFLHESGSLDELAIANSDNGEASSLMDLPKKSTLLSDLNLMRAGDLKKYTNKRSRALEDVRREWLDRSSKQMYDSRVTTHDVTIHCGDGSAVAHFAAICGGGQGFRSYLDNRAVPNESRVYKIDDYSVGIVECVISYLYHGKFKYEVESDKAILDLVRFSIESGLECLTKYCELVAQFRVSVTNFAPFLEVAVDNDQLTDLVAFIVEILAFEFGKLKTEDIQELPFEVMQMVLALFEKYDRSPDYELQTIMRWVGKIEKRIIEHLPFLIFNSRFSLASRKVKLQISKDPRVDKCQALDYMCKEALMYSEEPEEMDIE